jgi:hypothetical protein
MQCLPQLSTLFCNYYVLCQPPVCLLTLLSTGSNLLSRWPLLLQVSRHYCRQLPTDFPAIDSRHNRSHLYYYLHSRVLGHCNACLPQKPLATHPIQPYALLLSRLPAILPIRSQSQIHSNSSSSHVTSGRLTILPCPGPIAFGLKEGRADDASHDHSTFTCQKNYDGQLGLRAADCLSAAFFVFVFSQNLFVIIRLVYHTAKLVGESP